MKIIIYFLHRNPHYVPNFHRMPRSGAVVSPIIHLSRVCDHLSADGALHLNAKKRITGIPEAVWNYQIGGYKVLDKWFKEHKGEALTVDSFTHIENVVGLLEETIAIQEWLRDIHS